MMDALLILLVILGGLILLGLLLWLVTLAVFLLAVYTNRREL